MILGIFEVMMKTNYEQQAYEKSPLATLFARTIKKISQLKTSYSDAPIDSIKQLETIEACIDVLNEGLLPYFDNKTPGLWSLPGLSYQFAKIIKIIVSSNASPAQESHSTSQNNNILKEFINLNLSEIDFSGDVKHMLSLDLRLTRFITKILQIDAFKISQPVFLEFFVFLAAELDKMPKELGLLLSFLKPETIPELFSVLSERSLSVTHQQNYVYTAQYEPEGRNETRTFNLPAIYSTVHSLPKKIIVQAIIAYMKDDPTAVGIKDKLLFHDIITKVLPSLDLIRSEIMDEEQFSQKELAFFETLQKKYDLAINYQYKGIELIQHIEKLIKINAKLLKWNNSIQKYLDTNFDIKELYKWGWNENLKFLECIPYGISLNLLIFEKEKLVEDFHKMLSDNKEKFLAARQDAIEAWIDEVHSGYLENLRYYDDKVTLIINLVSFQNEADNLNEIKLSDNPIEVLEKHIECLKDNVLNLNELKQHMGWLTNYIPRILRIVSGNKSLEEALTKLSNQLVLDTTPLYQRIQLEMLRLHKEIEKTTQERRAALFAEKIHSADLEQMKQTIKDKESGQATLEDKINTLEAEFNKINRAIVLIDVDMKELNDFRILQETWITDVDFSIYDLLIESNEISEKFQSPNQPKSIIIEKCMINNFISWSDKEIIFLQTLFLQYEAECLQVLKPFNDKLGLLKKIDKILEINENEEKLHSNYIFFDDRKIPFQVLDRLINTSTNKNKLFILMGLDEKIACWVNYRIRQDEPLILPPDEKERNEARAILRKATDVKIKEVEKEIQDIVNIQAAKQHQITLSLEILSKNKELLTQKTVYKITLEEVLKSTKTAYAKLDNTKHQHEKVQKPQSEVIKALKNENESVQDTVTILKVMIEVFEGITKHAKLVESFCTSDVLFNMEDVIQFLVVSRNALQERKSLFSANLNKFETVEKSIYEAKLNQINDMLKNFDGDIKMAMQKKYEEYCIKPISKYQTAYDVLYEKYHTLIDNPKPPSTELVFDLMTKYDELSKLMKAHQVNLVSAKQVLTQEINTMVFTPLDAFYEQVQQDTQQSLDKLNTELSLLGANIEDHTFMWHIDEHTINVKLEGDNALIFISNVAYPEMEEQHLINTTLLQEVEKKLREVYGDFAQLVKIPENLETLKEKIKTYNEARTEAYKRLEASLVTNDALAQRIADRKLLVETQIYIVTTYLRERNPGQTRTKFIKDLQTKLNAYKESGKSAEVFEHIRIKRKEYTGGKLEHILNQLTAEIMDSDYKIPTSYVISEQEEISLDAQAAVILTGFGDQSDYYKRVMGLYDQVKTMRDFGNCLKVSDPCHHIAIDLANRLDEDICRFVIKHPNNAPGIDAYARFQDQFTARSHAKDEDMQPYLPRWAAIIANIAIAVVSLGFALGIKAISSYVKTGESFMFFTQSDMQEKVGELNKLAKEILLAPAVA